MNQRQGLLLPRQDVGTTTITSSTTSGTRSGKHQRKYTRIGTYSLLEQVPHDSTAFTQGLVMIGSCCCCCCCSSTHLNYNSCCCNLSQEQQQQHYLFEGTGLHQSSQLRQLDVTTGAVLSYHTIPKQYFGEGIAHYRRSMTVAVADQQQQASLHIIQLTWKNRIAFEYVLVNDDNETNNICNNNEKNDEIHTNDDRKGPSNWLSLFDTEKWTINTRKFRTSTNEGWGITYSYKENVLFISDGSDIIHVYDISLKQMTRTITVHYHHDDHMPSVHNKKKRIPMINELEYEPITDTIYANVWKEEHLLKE